ncbi:DNA topoisomerase 2 [Massospora cicadina]|nr:DNA topoisomerase 2 [Massospora cicadina]
MKEYEKLSISPENDAIAHNVRYYNGFAPVQFDECQIINLAFIKQGALPQGQPSVVDSLKPSQRKVMYGCFLRPDNEVNVVTLAGSIIQQGQQFQPDRPIDQFGSFTHGGKNSGATHYINICFKPIIKMLFRKDDMLLLNYLDAEVMNVEPKWIVPVVPIILLNGCVGIVDEYSNLLKLMHGESLITMLPWYLGFSGDIMPSIPNYYTVHR